MIRLIRELRQRRVFRGAGYYLIAAWGILQVGDVIVEPAGLPPWSMTALLYLLVLGFPIAMVLSWRYDIGEHGIVRTRRADLEDGAGPQRLGPVDYLLLVSLVAIGGFALYQLLPMAQQTDSGEVLAEGAGLDDVSPNSIAVLPFADISQNRDQEFLGDGISDTVMHVLSQIAGLDVTARTSSFAFKGQNLSVAEIASSLAVAHVLEGSVQRAADKVRIIARLIDARRGTEVWSGYFDRTIDSIFAIQDEIAREVATALTTKVLKRDEVQEIDEGYRPSLDAYEKFILGKQQLARRSAAGARAARDLFQEAIDLDPGYALAQAYLSYTAMFHGIQDRQASIEMAERAANRAIDLDPLLPEAHGASATVLVAQKRYPEAEAAIERALELSPSYADAYATHSTLLFMQGETDEALAKIRKAIELDPKEDRYKTQLAQALWSVSRAEEAIAVVKEAIEDNPSIPTNITILTRWEQQLGNMGRGAYWSHRAALLEPGTRHADWSECPSLVQLWAIDRAEACVRGFLEKYPDDVEGTQYLAIITRDRELALANLRAAVEDNPTFWYRRYQLADWLVAAGEWEEAIETLRPVAPGVFADDVEINDFTIWAAKNAGAAYLGLGEDEKATAILEAALAYIDRRRKLQASGFVTGIEDVDVLLLLGRTDEALARLRRSVDAGWRFYSFGLLVDSRYDAVRDDPRFREAIEIIERDLAEQLAWYDAHRDDPPSAMGIDV